MGGLPTAAHPRSVAGEEESSKRTMLRKRLAQRLRTGEGIDVDALAEVRREGWTRA